MKKSNIQLKYSGSAVKSGTMDVYDLAPALLAFGDLAKEINLIVNGQDNEIKVNIKSDFKKGSFEVNIELILSVYKQLETVIKTPEGILGATGVAELIAIYWNIRKHLRGEKPKEIVNKGDGTVIIVNGDGNKIVVSELIEEVLNSKKANSALADVVAKPLKKKGLDSVTLTDQNTGKSEKVSDNERNYFETLESEENKVEDVKIFVTEGIGFTISAIYFDTPTWRFSHAGTIRWIKIEDQEFLNKVHAKNESFRDGDILRVNLRTEQSMTDGKLKTNDYITKVLDHIRAPHQENLDLN